MTTEEKLDQLLTQQQQMLEMLKSQSHNILVLYRRTTALALMLEAISKDEKLKMPKVIRAEIDASLRPEEFVILAEQEPDEFKKRYGETVYKIWQTKGLNAISRLGEMVHIETKPTLQ